MLNRLMTGSRAEPAAVTLKEEVSASKARLKALTDEAEMKVLADLQIRLAMALEAIRRHG